MYRICRRDLSSGESPTWVCGQPSCAAQAEEIVALTLALDKARDEAEEAKLAVEQLKVVYGVSFASDVWARPVSLHNCWLLCPQEVSVLGACYFSHFRIIRSINKGSFGIILLTDCTAARLPDPEKRYALKGWHSTCP